MTTVAYLAPMKTLTFFLILLGLYSPTHAQTAADTAATQIRQLLKPGKHPIHYFRADPNQQLTPDQKAILAKVQKALSDNADKFLDPDSVQPKSVRTEDILDDIRKKLHLTEEEWKTFRDLTDFSKKNVQFYGNDTLDITRSGDILSFRGTGKASLLDSMSFDLVRNLALYRRKQIPFMRIMHVSATTNAFHTPGLTYAYQLENTSMADSTDVSTIQLERYNFGVSYQPLTGKTMIIFMNMTMRGVTPVAAPDVLTFIME